MVIRRTSSYVGRQIGEVIDDTLRGETIQVTRYGRVIAEFVSEIPTEGDLAKVSVTDFVGKVGHWTSVVEDEQKTLIIMRRDRPVVALRPFSSPLGDYLERRS